jgi:hypothetical protein
MAIACVERAINNDSYVNQPVCVATGNGPLVRSVPAAGCLLYAEECLRTSVSVIMQHCPMLDHRASGNGHSYDIPAVGCSLYDGVWGHEWYFSIRYVSYN